MKKTECMYSAILYILPRVNTECYRSTLPKQWKTASKGTIYGEAE